MSRKTPISFDFWKYVEKHWTAHSEWTKKHENQANHNTDYIASDLIDFLGDDWKENNVLAIRISY